MVDLANLFDLQLEIFLIMMLGYFLNKWGMIKASARKSITDLVIYVVLPGNIIYSFLTKMDMEVVITSGLIILFVSLAIQIFCELISKWIYPMADTEQRKVLTYATICSNAGFMGSPLIQGLYGLPGLLFASIYLIPQRIVMWSSGIACFSSATGKEVLKKVLTHPCIIAVEIGILIMLLQLPLPAFLTKTITVTSNCTTFLSMIVIGGILAEIDIRTVVNKISLYYSIIRLLILPSLVFVVCYFLQLPSLVIAVSTVLAGMPAGSTTAILAEKYQGDAPLAVQLIFLSTALSLCTIPILCILMDAFL